MRLLAVCLSLLVAPMLVAESSFESQLESFQSLTGDFEQEVYSSEEELLESSSGQFSLRQPDKFRWQIEKPSEQLLILSEGQLLQYDKELETATLDTLSSADLSSPLAILGGDMKKLQEAYAIRQLSQETYEVAPLGANDSVTLIVINFENSLPRQMEVWDRLGQTTRLTFSDVTANPDLPVDEFEFSPPPGVDYYVND